jgi:hypothetical protein
VVHEHDREHTGTIGIDSKLELSGILTDMQLHEKVSL